MMAKKVKKQFKIAKQSRQNERDVLNRVRPSSDVFYFSAIVLVAFCLRMIYLLQIESIPLFYHLAGDGGTYDEWAQRIAAGDWLGQGVFYQAPLYPYFLGLLQTVIGHDLWSIRIIQIILGSVSCGLIFLAGRSLFSRSTALIAGLLLAFYAPAIFFDGLIEKSILDIFLLSTLLLLLSSAERQQQSTLWLATGVALGLLGLSRENALVLALVIPAWIVVYFRDQLLSTRLKCLGFFFAGLLCVLVPVGVRNLSRGGEFKLTTSQFGTNFYIGNNPAADGTYGSVRAIIGAPHLEGRDAQRLAEKALGRSLMPGEVSRYWLEESWSYIRTQPAEWLGLLAKKWLLVWNSREIEDSDDFYIYQQWSGLLALLGHVNHFGLLAPLAAIGLLLSIKQWRRLWLLYAMILTLAASVSVFYVFGRYRFTLVPLLVLFAGAGLVQVTHLYKQRRWRQLLIACVCLAASAVIVNWPILGITGPGAAGYNNLANAYYKQGRVEEAAKTALKAVELRPEYGVAHFNLGNIFARQGKFDLAQRHFEEAVRLYPNYAELRSNLGQLLAERGDLQAGMEQFRKAIELNPALSGAHLNLGVVLAKQGRIDEADASLRVAVRLMPRSAETRFYLGSVYAAQNRYAEAAESFQESLQIDSDFAPAHHSLAQVLSAQGKKEEALRHYQEAARILQAHSGRSAPR
jgi:tetratricopeptide (TPR) repeat protein